MSLISPPDVHTTLRTLFKTSTGGWRSDGHVLLALLKQQLHANASKLRDSDPATREEAGVNCSAIVKVDLAVAELTGLNSSEHLLDATRLLGLAGSVAGSDKVSQMERYYTDAESAAVESILELLKVEAGKRHAARSVAFPPILSSLAQPLRYANGVREASALGPNNAKFVNTDRASLMDEFVDAHARPARR